MIFTVLENQPLTASVYRMVLAGDTAGITVPGQFVQLQLPGFYLRRPISVCDWEEGKLTLVYKVVGEGTDAMSTYQAGMTMDVLTGLGNGFDPAKTGEKPLLIGGGVGLPPLYGLCKRLLAMGKKPTVLAGFGKADEIFLKEDFEKLGVNFVVTTMDGSAGIKGLVTDALSAIDYDSICSCGPLPMMRAIHDRTTVPALYSFEERMGCGFGACMGCSVRMKSGYKRVCKDGPVFDREEVLW